MTTGVLHLDITNVSGDAPCEAAVLTRLASDALAASGRCGTAVREVTLSVVCVDRAQMQEQNMRLRGVDAPTDVLSCGHYSDQADMRHADIAHLFLGEVIMCYTQITQYAYEDGKDPLTEFYIAFVHGVLHLAGLHHGAHMFRVQQDVVRHFLAEQ